ncbi:MAG: hypothetical protein AAGH40_09280 [Verrucomicrobiota bacterium]
MKTHIPETFSKEIWEALYAILRDKEIEGLEQGASIDGIIPREIETNKNGISIEGDCWFLRGANKKENQLPLRYHLNKPRFSSIESVSPDKIKKSNLSVYSHEEGSVFVKIE